MGLQLERYDSKKSGRGLGGPVGTNGCPQRRGSPVGASHGRRCRQLRGCLGQARSDPGLLGNRGNRAPDRPTPVTARSDMRRRLTGPARAGHPRNIASVSRPVPCSRPPVPGRRPDLAMSVKAQVTAVADAEAAQGKPTDRVRSFLAHRRSSRFPGAHSCCDPSLIKLAFSLRGRAARRIWRGGAVAGWRGLLPPCCAAVGREG
jgi:hypothetical protein